MIESLNSKILQQHLLSEVVQISQILVPFISFERLNLFSSKRAESGRRGILEGMYSLRRTSLKPVGGWGPLRAGVPLKED
jgi:hypothetical protein